jgi:hypothetical protein
MNESTWSASQSASLALGSAIANPITGREPVKHLLIGAPPAVRITIHRLHVLGYAEAGDWSTLLALPDQPIVITPKPGDVMSSLIKYLRLID